MRVDQPWEQQQKGHRCPTEKLTSEAGKHVGGGVVTTSLRQLTDRTTHGLIRDSQEAQSHLLHLAVASAAELRSE